MSARRIVAPVNLPVLLDAAISNAKANGAGMEADIELDVRGIAGEVQHKLGRALIEQTWRVTLDEFPPSIKLPMPPMIGVDHIKFYDVDGVLQTLDAQDYLVDDASEPCHVMPAPGRRWPDTAVRKNAVQVQYRCGYGADASAVPAEIQTYILGRVEAKRAPADNKNEKFLEGLLAGFKVYRL